MTEKQLELQIIMLTRRLEALEEAMKVKTGLTAHMPKYLPFSETTPLSQLVKPNSHILLCSTIDLWRQYLINGQGVNDLDMYYFDFKVSVYDYQQMIRSLTLLLQQNAFICSVHSVAWYFVQHTNFNVSHYTIYSAMLRLCKE